MRKNHRLLGLLLLALVSGCSKQLGAPVKPATSGAPPEALHEGPTAARQSYSPDIESAPPPAEAPVDDASHDWVQRSEQAGPQFRPGLATSWGEDRHSPVSTRPFVRADSDQPFSVLRLLYNDRAGVSAMVGSGRSGQYGDGSASTPDGTLTVRLLDSSGRSLPSLATKGRTYVIGEAASRYVIEIQNHSAHRFEVVATVDGLDVVDGQPGSFDKRGYLLQGFSRLVIDGFRQSMRHVAAFRFGAVHDSYAAKKGDATNVGVIGVAFFQEHGQDIMDPQEAERRHRADPFPARFAVPPSISR